MGSNLNVYYPLMGYRIMSQVLQVGGHRIDRPSQIILGELKTKEWTLAKPLAELAELGQNTQVFYRMDNHLKPVGLVEEQEREDRPTGYEEPRRFRLTDEGELWVEGHAQEIHTPATRAETQHMARDAHDAAESAKDSVQSYRKKIHRLKGRVEELEELPERVRETETKLTYQAESLDDIRESVKDTQQSHDQFVDDVHEEFTDVHGEIDALDDRLGRVERKLDALLRERAAAEREQEQSGVLGF
jgi:chromosome segregation ATPase